jgi:plastocyanin
MGVRRSTLLAACCLLGLAAGAKAQAADQGAELARLKQEVRELRQLLIQAMQVEQQHHDLVLRLMQTGERPVAAPGAALSGEPGAALAGPHDRALAPTGTVSGTVQLQGIPAGQPVYVFVEDLRGPIVRGRSTEIVQKEKQFTPQVSAVQRGTSILFPNSDRVAHNVFSVSKRNTFDLGLLRSGERGSPVVLTQSGVVEIYCDIHSGMWAEVLVTPNQHFTRVTDGTFRLPNVPAGKRLIAAWTAGAQPARRTVNLTSAGAQLDLSLAASPRKSHFNKAGQAYPSYGD